MMRRSLLERMNYSIHESTEKPKMRENLYDRYFWFAEY
jgi:hypothetical protein